MNIIERNNPLFFSRLKSDVGESARPWAVDGVCCVGKSSLGQRYKMAKTNRSIHTIGQDLHLSGSMGYTFSSRYLQLKNPEYLWDRCYFNNLIWEAIWHAITATEREQYDANEAVSVYSKWLDAPTFAYMTTECNIVILVVNDPLAVRHRLRMRDRGNDRVRSHSPIYVSIQNGIYKEFSRMWVRNCCMVNVDWFESLMHCQNALCQLFEKFAPKLNVVSSSTSYPPPLFNLPPIIEGESKRILTRDSAVQERVRPLYNRLFYQQAQTNENSSSSGSSDKNDDSVMDDISVRDDNDNDSA